MAPDVDGPGRIALPEPVVPVDLPAVRDALLVDASDLASFIRRAPGLDAPVPGLEWSVSEVVAHLTVTFVNLSRAIRGDDIRSEWDHVRNLRAMPPPQGSLADRITLGNATMLSLYADVVPDVSAETYQEAVVDLVAAIDDVADPEAPVHLPWLNIAIPTSTLAAYAVVENLVHGLDIGRGLGQRGPLRRRSGSLAVPRVATTFMPVIARPQAMAGPEQRFELRFRGTGERVHVTIGGGRSEVVRAGEERLSTWLSADPTALILITYRRMSALTAFLAGWTFGWGPGGGLKTFQIPAMYDAP